eukprot:m.224691 g.224691  ORF g.224691 m.224691 type:complete len:62 (-) comp17034_c3_seq2:676-861(-)
MRQHMWQIFSWDVGGGDDKPEAHREGAASRCNTIARLNPINTIKDQLHLAAQVDFGYHSTA